MATATQTPPEADNDASNGDELNPGQRHFDREFNGIIDPANYSHDGKEGDLSGGPKQGDEKKGLFRNDDAEKAHDSSGQSPSSLNDAESNPAGTAGGLFKPADSGGSGSWKSRLLGADRARGLQLFAQALSGHRKRNIIGGGILGGGAVITLLTFSFISGPLEFVHIAQLMEKFHFSSQQDAEDGRMTKIARYLRDPSKPQNTRLGLVGNAVADRLETKIYDATGLSPKYDTTTGTFEGYTADPEHDNFKGQNIDEMKATLSETYGIDTNSIQTTTVNGKETILYNPDTGSFVHSIGDYRAQTKFSRTLLGKAGLSKISARLGTRVLKTRAGWTFHPIKKLEANYQSQLIKLGKAALDKLRNQFDQGEKATIESDSIAPSGTPAAEGEGNANTQPDPNAETAKNTANDIKANPSESNIKLKVAAGGASLVAVLCIARNLGAHISEERIAKVVLPEMKLAGQFVSLGSQVMTGQDIDMTQLGFFHQFLDGKDSQGNPSTWINSKSIQGELGNSQAGQDIPTKAQVYGNTNPLSFLNFPPLPTICGALSSTFGTIFSFVIAPFTSFVGGEAIKYVTNFLAGWLSGSPINIFTDAGPNDGSYINYGSREAANQQYASAGGVPLDPGQELVLKDTTNSLDQADFATKSIAYRLFNPYDDQTAVSKVIDNYGGQSPGQELADLGRGLASIFPATLKGIASLVTAGHASAASTSGTTTPVDYHGLKASGFSANDLSDPTYDNSFDNSCYVTGDIGQGCKISTTGEYITQANSVLGRHPDYVDRVTKCFGDTISYDSTQNMWNIDFKGNGPIDTNASSYPSGCSDTTQDWVRVRFWLLDTQAIEGYDCYAGGTSTSNQSCQDLNANTGGTSSSSSTAGGLGVSADGFVFPEQTTKTKIQAGSAYNGQTLVWCYTSQTNCHHDYNAADIFDPTGTPVVAVRSGSIVYEVNDASGGTGSFVILKTDPDPDGKSYIFYYGHLGAGSVTVQTGQTVKAGQVLGAIGTAADAQGTSPHLHIDAQLSPPATTRQPCTNTDCAQPPFNFINIQPVLTQAYAALPQ